MEQRNVTAYIRFLLNYCLAGKHLNQPLLFVSMALAIYEPLNELEYE